MTLSDASSDYSEISNCRICKSTELREVLDLGIQPLANALRNVGDSSEEKKFPLVLIRCKDCTSIQLSVNVNPTLMFQEYLWVTGTTDTARNHCENIVTEICDRSRENPSILEIGSNDGTLLKAFKEISTGKLFGVDPAKEISNSIQESEIEIFANFFTSEFGRIFKQNSGYVDVVVARNVLSHVPDLLDVMTGIDTILAPDGIFVVEFHEASKILKEIHYDSIYHEHTFYHSIRSMTEAQKQVGLIPFDLLESPISGGSFILISSREIRKPSSSLQSARGKEILLEVESESAWLKFAELARQNLDSIREFLDENQSRKIRAFGASARSSTLLNAIGDKAGVLHSIADNNPLKWGKLSPGHLLTIDSPNKVIDDSVEIIFICPFNFEEEIVFYLQSNLDWHGKVYLPLPGEPRIYTI